LIIKEIVENKKLIWTAFACSLVFLFIAFKFFISELPDKNSIAKISGILKDEIKIERKGRGKKSLLIKLKNYPEIDFMIGSIALDETYSQELINENRVGDSINLFIENKEFRRKIVKTEKITFPENILHPQIVDIVEIDNGKSNYLFLKDYRKEHQRNNYLGAGLFGVLSLLMFFLGIKVLRHGKNMKF